MPKTRQGMSPAEPTPTPSPWASRRPRTADDREAQSRQERRDERRAWEREGVRLTASCGSCIKKRRIAAESGKEQGRFQHKEDHRAGQARPKKGEAPLSEPPPEAARCAARPFTP